MATDDGRALNEREIERIKKDYWNGISNDQDIMRVFETVAVQRRVLHELLNQFRSEPMRLVSVAEPIRNSSLAHLKELVSMEDRT